MTQTPSPQDQKTIFSMIQQFFRLEAAGGIVLIGFSVLALLIANSPLYEFHVQFFEHIKFRIGLSLPSGQDIQLNKPILLWVNDGIMAIFFFLIGLEIKRELMEGELSSRERAVLPALAALGGMIVPAGIYFLINQSSPDTIAGWAIPSATDIAFALCIIALTGDRVPISIKILLMAIAVIDDLGAIMIIAIFYNHGFDPQPLAIGAGALIALFMLNRRNIVSVFPYILFGLVLWVAILQSGIHATLAGVITALFIPLRDRRDPHKSPATSIEHHLHPWVAFMVLPLFGLANAGVPLTGMGLDSFKDPVTLGIMAGLLIGKPLGIFTVLFLTIRLGLSPMPHQATWAQVFGVSVLCGIGFTMSLFIGSLAFEGSESQAAIRLGVLGASVIAAVAGYCILRYGPTNNQPAGPEKFLAGFTQQVDFSFLTKK